MAEPNVSIADSTPESEKKAESVPEADLEPTPASIPVTDEPEVEEAKFESREPKEAAKTEKPAAPAVEEAATRGSVGGASPSVVESPAVSAEHSKEVKSESAETETPPETKEEVPAPVVESKAIGIPLSKTEHPTLLQKLKKTFEFPKSHKIKESPSKEPPMPVPDAPMEPAPAAEASAAAEAPAPSPAPAPETEIPSPVAEAPAAAAPETKPTASEKVAEKVSEGKGFFNKVKKSFFTKSHSFSGSIPDTKLGVAPPAPPAAIPEAPKEIGNVVDPSPAATESAGPVGPDTAAETAPAPVATDVAPSTPEEVPKPAAEGDVPAADVCPAPEDPKVTAKESVEEKPVKEDKPKSKFFQKIVRRLLPKASHNSPPSAAPAAAPVVAASA